MDTIHIKDTPDIICPNFHFTYHDFFQPEFGGGVEFDIPKCLVIGVETLRNWFGLPMDVTSTIRFGSNQGFHSYADGFGALDTVPSNRNNWYEIKTDFEDECATYQKDKSSQLIYKLRSIGVKGFGIEGSCIHIDYRPDEHCTSSDEFGKYCIFEWHPDGTPQGKSEVLL